MIPAPTFSVPAQRPAYVLFFLTLSAFSEAGLRSHQEMPSIGRGPEIPSARSAEKVCATPSILRLGTIAGIGFLAGGTLTIRDGLASALLMGF